MKKLFRFQLRTLLFTVALVGCFGEWLAGHEYSHRSELKVIEEVAGKRAKPVTRDLLFNDSECKLGLGIYDDSILG